MPVLFPVEHGDRLRQAHVGAAGGFGHPLAAGPELGRVAACLLYTSDAADERSSVDLGGRRIITKKNTQKKQTTHNIP